MDSTVTFVTTEKDATLTIEATGSELVISREQLGLILGSDTWPGMKGSFVVELYDVVIEDETPDVEVNDIGDDFETRLRRLEDLAKRAREQYGL